MLGYALTYNNCPFAFYFDATASGLQMLALMLEPKSQEIAESLNLKSTSHWFDTYDYLINKFRELHDIRDDVKHLFVRKNLKNSIMVANYGGTYFGSRNSFLDKIGNLRGSECNVYVMETFKKFYDYVQSVFAGDTFFKIGSPRLIQNMVALGPHAFMK